MNNILSNQNSVGVELRDWQEFGVAIENRRRKNYTRIKKQRPLQ